MRFSIAVCLSLSLIVGSSLLVRRTDFLQPSVSSLTAEASIEEYAIPDPFSPYPDGSNGIELSAVEVTEAVDFWRRQLLTNSTNGRAHYYIANGLLIQGEYLDAAAAYRKAIAYEPTNELSYRNLALILILVGEAQDERIELLRESARLAPDNISILSTLASQLQDQGYYAESADVFTQALQLDDDNVYMHLSLGESLSAQRKYAEAATAYRNAMRLAPNDDDAREGLAKALYRQGQVEEAVAVDRRVHYYIADVYSIREQHVEAEINYREAVRLNPDFAEAHIKLASTLHELDKVDEAKTFYEQAIEMVEDNPSSGGPFLQYLYDSYSSLLREQGLDTEPAVQERLSGSS